MKKYSRSPKALFVQQGEEIAILNSVNNKYFAIDEVGAFIWNKLESNLDIDELVLAVMAEYEVTKEDCLQDTRDFINELLTNQLVEESEVVA